MPGAQKGTGYRIGLVDDDALTLAALHALITQRLAGEGVSVAWTTRSGETAIDLCVDERSRPDAVLVDMGMDDVDGASVLERIRRFSSRIMLLAMTSHSLNRYRASAQRAGAGILLDKSDIAGLLCCLRDCVSGDLRPSPDGISSPAAAVVGYSDCESSAPRSLSSREAEVMDWTIEGLTAKEVSLKMSVSESTVKTHIRHAIEKLQVRNKLQAVRAWSEIRRGQ